MPQVPASGLKAATGLAGQYAAVEPAMTGPENLHMVARLFGHSPRQAAASTDAVLAQLGLIIARGTLAELKAVAGKDVIEVRAHRPTTCEHLH